jgi:hypothetical protein
MAAHGTLFFEIFNVEGNMFLIVGRIFSFFVHAYCGLPCPLEVSGIQGSAQIFHPSE